MHERGGFEKRQSCGHGTRRKSPLLGIFPRSTPGDPVRDKIAEVDKIFQNLMTSTTVFYMDFGAKFRDEKGYILPEAFRTGNLQPQAKRLRHYTHIQSLVSFPFAADQ